MRKELGVKTSVLDSAAQVASKVTLSVNWGCFHLIFAYEKLRDALKLGDSGSREVRLIWDVVT